MSQPLSPPDPKRWIALILLCAAQFMVVLDASIVNVALPSIQTDLNFSQENLQWVVNACTLVFGGFLLLGGRTADLLGRRRVFIVGLGLFSLASLLGGLATNENQLIAARALQGLGAAIISPAALSIVTTTFAEGSERNKALGIWGAIAGLGGAAGVLLGGMLTEWAGWEWVLFVNVPIGIAAAVFTPRFVRESRAEGANRSFDALGAVTITAALVLLVYTLVKAQDVGWGAGRTLGGLAGSAALVGLFILIEARSKSPLAPLKFFRLRTPTSANVLSVLIAASLFSMFYFISLYLQRVLGFSALEAGLAYLPLAGTIVISAGVASQAVERIGVKPALVFGLSMIAIGLAWFSRVDADGTYVKDVLGPSIVAAVGLGFSFVPVTIAAVAGVPNDEAGLASGLVNTSQQVGGALGLAILATIANSTTTGLPGGAQNPVALTEGFQDAFLVGAGFALLGVVLALVLLRHRQLREAQRALAAREQVAAVPA